MARSKTGHRAGMGGSISVGPAADAGSGTQSRGVKSTVKSANRAKGTLKRSGVRVPKVNLDNTYGISIQKADTRSAVTGPKGVTSRNLPNNQGALTKKAGRFTK